MDTIAAIATPAGVGGLAVIRVSGPQALAIVLPFLQGRTLSPRHATYTSFVTTSQFLDEVVATYFPAPHSYTGDDVVEISCHGSRYVQQTLLLSLLQAGCRLADPGEFTQRAFLNGRIDLSQAEAVADLIDSANAASHALAVSQLRGSYAVTLKTLRQQLVDLTGLMELELDFTDEDLQFADRDQLRGTLLNLRSQCACLLDSFALGNAIKEGIPVAIVGQPNVGKSTLLNALLGDDRAIVSDIPGTTRDTIEEQLNIAGLAFRFIDTAGIRATPDAVEQQGVRRSYRAIDQARIVVAMLDATSPIDQSLAAIADLRVHLRSQHLVVLLNKTDLVDGAAVCSQLQSQGLAVLPLAAKQGVGIEQLKQRLLDSVDLGSDPAARLQSPMLTNVRHRDALCHVVDALAHVLAGLDNDVPTDLLLVDLRDALYHLGTITGHITSNEVLHSIFSRFCIGK